VRNALGKFLDQAFSTGERDKFRPAWSAAPSPTHRDYISHRGLVE